MRKDDIIYVGHMLDLSEKIINKTKGCTRIQYDADDNLKLALAHLVQTIGESARRVSLDFQKAHPEIP